MFDFTEKETINNIIRRNGYKFDDEKAFVLRKDSSMIFM